MRYKFWFFPLFVILACGSADDKPTTQQEFDYEDFITINDQNRRFLIHLPAGYNDQDQFPLNLVLHGGRGTPENFRTLSNMDIAADAAGYIAVYPEGFQKFWADGRGGTPADEAGINDVEFLDQLITKLAVDLNVDTNRVFATGISNGGGMSQRLACEIPDKIKGIAVVAHSMLENTKNNCTLAQSLAAMFILGTADPLNPYEGGINEAGDSFLGADSAVDFRVSINNCTLQANDSLPNVSTTDETTTSIKIYRDCLDVTEIRLYTVHNGGHTWPRLQGGQYLPIQVIGRVSNDFEASFEILNFFDTIE